jgi:hypothetical protein
LAVSLALPAQRRKRQRGLGATDTIIRSFNGIRVSLWIGMFQTKAAILTLSVLRFQFF